MRKSKSDSVIRNMVMEIYEFYLFIEWVLVINHACETHETSISSMHLELMKNCSPSVKKSFQNDF